VSTALARTTPTSVARETIHVHSKSFALASKLLGERLRDETAILYTWCRRADDAIDHAPSRFDAREELLRLNRELDAAYRGTARDPVMAAFGDLVRARNIPPSYPAALLAGMEMDVAGTSYTTIDELIVYCYRVAGVVGLMMSHVFGVRDDDALVHAAHLGIGMQLTNICRDVAEDAERDRVYIPSELLVHHGMEGSVRELLALADRYYASGAAGEHALPWRAAVAVRAARGIYSAIGSEIAAQDHDVMAGRAVVPRRRKIAHVALATLRTLAELPWRPFACSVRTPTRTLEVGDVPRV